MKDYMEYRQGNILGYQSKLDSIPNKPLLTMVVAAYNRPRSIVLTLASFYTQTYQNFEVLVVHDGPGDGTVKNSVEMFNDSRFQYLELPENMGHPGNYCKEFGEKMAKGDYIGHSNDDNYYCPVYFEWMLSEIVNRNVGFAYCNMIHSAFQYQALTTQPAPCYIDGGGWIAAKDVIDQTPWPKDMRSDTTDGHYAQALAHVRGSVKIPGFLFTHN